MEFGSLPNPGKVLSERTPYEIAVAPVAKTEEAIAGYSSRSGQWIQHTSEQNDDGFFSGDLQLSFLGRAGKPVVILIQHTSEQNDDGFSCAAKEGKLQIAGVFDLPAKLAKLICHRVDNTCATVRERELHVAANNLGMANVQQLPGDDEAIALLLQFDLEIDLIRLSAVEHLPDSRVRRARSSQSRLRKAVK